MQGPESKELDHGGPHTQGAQEATVNLSLFAHHRTTLCSPEPGQHQHPHSTPPSHDHIPCSHHTATARCRITFQKLPPPHPLVAPCLPPIPGPVCETPHPHARNPLVSSRVHPDPASTHPDSIHHFTVQTIKKSPVHATARFQSTAHTGFTHPPPPRPPPLPPSHTHHHSSQQPVPQPVAAP